MFTVLYLYCTCISLLETPVHPDFPDRTIWFRMFSQDPDNYAWFFMCDNSTATTTYDFDSCLQGHMDLLITDARTAPTDKVNLEETHRRWGTLVSDETRYIGSQKFSYGVSIVWKEGEPGKICIRLTRLCMQYTAIFHGSKNVNFQMKTGDIFLKPMFAKNAQNIDRGYTLEPPH